MHTIRNNLWLTDTSVNVFQNMLHQQFPFCEGLEDTTLGPHFQFSIHKNDFVQVLHNGNNHWVCVSNIGCQTAEVNYYDSLFTGDLKPSVKKQIASLMNETGPEIAVNVIPVQQQTNAVDCGPFSLAFATSLLNNDNPAQVVYNEARLREHLITSHKNNTLLPFPQETLPGALPRRAKAKTITLELHCLCRLPWDNTDRKNPAYHMAQCDKCTSWFHRECAKIPSEVFEKKNHSWSCQTCS